jgi:NAD-dependent dihydropyrimidine dehydrogenase PreA subunit
MPLKIDRELCIGCGTCIAVCPTGVFEMEEGKSSVAHPSACIGCRACILNCPEGIISLKKGYRIK